MESTESPPSVSIEQLLSEVRDARKLVARERGPARQPTESKRSPLLRSITRVDKAESEPDQARLLNALEAAAAALESAGHPVPYRMRDELAMRRRLAGLGGVPRAASR